MLRYSEIPNDFSTENLQFSELADEQVYRSLSDDSPPSDIEPSIPLIKDDKTESKCTESAPVRDQRSRKNSSNCIDRPALSQSISGGYYNYSLGDMPTNKTKSLPLNVSTMGLGAYSLSALRISPDELANQITILDFPDFRSIQPDELTSCAWTNKKNKHIVAPHIVAFTKRFNHTSFWTVQEILSAPTPKQRAEILAHFIKVAKKLFELNNLHSLFAIVSAMQTASIFRLAKTWSCLSRKDRNTFERLADIFNDNANWTNLRAHLESLRLPCIPYLGLFLTDLVYIDLAHPHPSGGLEPEPRRNQMNNILRIIASYQGSDYSHIAPVVATQRFLQSIRYIEELQNIFEDDQYKISIKLEPPPSAAAAISTLVCGSEFGTTSTAQPDSMALASLNLTPTKTSGSMRLTTSASKFIPGHRKCRSLGSKFRSTSLPRNFHQKCYCAILVPVTTASVATPPTNTCMCRIFNKTNSQVAPSSGGCENAIQLQPRHLLDDSVLEDRLTITSDATSTGSSEEGVLENGYSATTGAITPSDFSTLQDTHMPHGFQGCVRRKTLLKDGRKPAVASWQRYWLQLWSNSLVYFPPKSFKGTERTDFKREPCKVCSLNGWSAQLLENSQQINTFQLINTQVGTVYKFRTSSPEMTTLWLESLRRDGRSKSATNLNRPIPVNLMTFE